MLKEQKLVKFVRITVNKKDIGKNFKADSKLINDAIEEWNDDEKLKYQKEMEEKGQIVFTA